MLDTDSLWRVICEEARELRAGEPVLADFFQTHILDHENFGAALVHRITSLIASEALAADGIGDLCRLALDDDPHILRNASMDLQAHVERDAACDRHVVALLYFKGFQALQCQRIAHWLWCRDRCTMALLLHSQMVRRFTVDIHPGAVMGSGIMLDHATGLVIGETAVVGNDVSMLHSVTLGGSGAAAGDRHPKIASGVLIAAGAKILGNINVGQGAKVGAGSLVLESVPPHVTVAGVPATVVGIPREISPALEMDQGLGHKNGDALMNPKA